MKRTLDSFFISTAAKRSKTSGHGEDNESLPDQQRDSVDESSDPFSNHATYPFALPQLPSSLVEGLGFVPASEPRLMNDQPDLDLHYYAPYIPSHIHKQLFEFLRNELFFYRVQYQIKRGAMETQVTTPRYTTVFGVDATSHFASHPRATTSLPAADPILLETSTQKPVTKDKYSCAPRPLPQCLASLREITEAATGETFNFCLVNYYASGADSIAYHSDDERFLGVDPAIASLSLGATRDFLMKHKPANVPTAATAAAADPQPCAARVAQAATKPLKLALGSGDMLLMRGRTQSQWLHSLPKRAGPGSGSGGGGRINITFRKALVKGGTENYYRYNVGSGGVFKWDGAKREMAAWPREAHGPGRG